MAEHLVPATVRTAAKRGFIRTATQTLASAIPTAGIAIVTTGEWALGVGLGAAGALVSAVLAGGASYLSILSSGIPEDYQPDSGI